MSGADQTREQDTPQDGVARDADGLPIDEFSDNALIGRRHDHALEPDTPRRKEYARQSANPGYEVA